MASVKLEDCSQTLELNANIKDEEEEEKIRTTVSHDRLRLSLRPVTSTVRTNQSCHSPSTLSPNLQSLGPDCDSGAQFALQDPEMTSVKLEDCSQTLKLNVIIKDEEEEEEIGTSVSHGQGLSHGWDLGGHRPTWEPGPANQHEFFPTKRLDYRQKYCSPPSQTILQVKMSWAAVVTCDLQL
ncbi:uncharacterized protein LOC110516275 isoform X3 [Oncorhynchus mykiss]|uniref:uncharacterized protein LOC110516275 isoform X3 n=1 Tax=Oncorhynchus mykiss TaxID=8022 RepID=UPI001877AFB4|nr:uncharacterized protein LOC110516275 isoform X3 [Oncorhynchus mykiss]